MIEGEKQWSVALAAATPSEVQALHAALARVEATTTLKTNLRLRETEPRPRVMPRRAAASLRAGYEQLAWSGYEELSVPGTREEFDVAVRAVQHALRCGLKLPPYRLAWFFSREDWDSPEDWTHGLRGVTFITTTPVRVYVRSGLELTQLVRTILHELQHVADALHPDLSPDEREQRAEAFVIEAMACWEEGRLR